jgi:hypothetical protein
MGREVLGPNQFFKFLGYLPSWGEPRNVRYRRYSDDMVLTSNVGKGRFDTAEVSKARWDKMATRSGSFELIKRVAPGEIEAPQYGWQHPRVVAIEALGDERFDREEVVLILMQIDREAKQFSRHVKAVLRKLGVEQEETPR